MKPLIISRKTIYQSDWVNLHLDKVAFPDGRIVEHHHCLDFPKEGVAILIENTHELLLIESYRYITDTIAWEVPAGGIEKGESFLEAAAREAQEETGYTTVDHKLIYTYNPISGIGNKVFHIVQCRAKETNGIFDKNEVRSVKWFNQEEIEELIDNHEIKDGFTLSALLLYLKGK